MAGRNLGDAFVVISPETSTFLAELTTKVKAAVSQVKPEVKVGADTKPAEAAMAALLARVKTLAATLAGMRADVDTKAEEAKIARMQAQAMMLDKTLRNMKADVDSAGIMSAEARMLGLEAATEKTYSAAVAARFALDKLAVTGPAHPITAKLDLAAANTALAAFGKTTEASSARLRILDGSLVKTGMDAADMAQRLRSGNAALAIMGGQAAKTATQVMDGRNAIAGLAASGQGATRAMQNMAAATAIMSGESMRFAMQARGMGSAVRSVVPAINDTESAWAKLQGWAFKGGGGFWGLGGAIGGVKLWHVALDGVIEAIIAVSGAVIAATAGIAAMSESAYDVGVRLHSVQVVSGALGQDIPPLTGKFDALMTAMAPRTIEAFGGGLALINSQSGGLLKVMEPVVNLFDTWIAKIDIWVAHQASFAGAVTHGTEYLAQFGQIIGQITEAIHNLLSKDPGIAHYLLDILVAASKLLDAFTKLPGPIVELTIGLHGLYVWAAVLSGVFLKMLNPLVSMVGWVIKLGAASKVAAGEVALLSEAKLAGTAAADAQAVGGLAGALGKAAGGARAFGAGLVALATNPFVWLAVAAAGLAYVAYQSHQADASTKKFLSDMDTGLARLSGGDAILKISSDVGALNDKIATTTSATFLPKMSEQLSSFGFHGQATADALLGIDKNFGKAIGDVPQMLSSWKNLTNAGKDLAHAVSSIFHPGQAAASVAVTNAVKAYHGEIVKLNAEQTTLFKATGNLVSQGYSVQQSFALMTLAGVKASDSLEVMNQKVANLIIGYKNVTGTGGMLESSVDAVSFAALQQQEKVNDLNNAWDAFFKTVTGGETGFVAFATQTNGLYKSLADGGVKLSDSNGKIRLSTTLAATAADKGNASMTGLNAASLQARNTFLQTANAANTQMDNLNLLANAAGLGQHGVNMLAQANKDMVASMIPAAKGSQAMTDILYAMAQRGGYKGADSLKELSKWAVNTKNPIKNLDDITTTFTTDASNLAGDVKNLSIALGTTLTDAMNAAVFQATGGKKSFDDFATAVLNTSHNSQQTQDTAQALADQLFKLTGNVSDTKDQFMAFARGSLHLTKDESNLLWSEISSKLSPVIDDLSKKNVPAARAAFEAWAGKGGKSGLGMTHTEADSLWKMLTGTFGPTLTDLTKNKTPAARAAFEAWAGPDGKSGLGLTKKQADALWTQLTTKLGPAIQNLPSGKTITITEKGLGSFSVSQAMTAANNPAFGISGRAAAGMYVANGTGPTADDQLIWASKGELVVPAGMVAGGAVDHLRGAIPGFAAGGLVPSYKGDVGGLGPVDHQERGRVRVHDDVGHGEVHDDCDESRDGSDGGGVRFRQRHRVLCPRLPREDPVRLGRHRPERRGLLRIRADGVREIRLQPAAHVRAAGRLGDPHQGAATRWPCVLRLSGRRASARPRRYRHRAQLDDQPGRAARRAGAYRGQPQPRHVHRSPARRLPDRAGRGRARAGVSQRAAGHGVREIPDELVRLGHR